MNQHGEAQVVGGVAHKVEGFFRACLDKPEGLTGEQGAIVPASNTKSLVVQDDLADAVREGRFHIYTVAHVTEALALLLGAPCGEPDADGTYPPESVFGRVQTRLANFNDRIAASRGAG